MFNPTILYSAGAALALGLVSGWTVRDWKADSDSVAAYEKAEKVRERLQARYDSIALGYEADRANADANSIIRQTELRTIYRDIPTDGDCAAPDAARRLLENSVDEANARLAGKPVDAVSEVAAPSKPAE